MKVIAAAGPGHFPKLDCGLRVFRIQGFRVVGFSSVPLGLGIEGFVLLGLGFVSLEFQGEGSEEGLWLRFQGLPRSLDQRTSNHGQSTFNAKVISAMACNHSACKC